MNSTLLSPYFLAGLLAVVFFFLSAALVGLSLFAEPEGKRKLLRAEGISLMLVLAILTWLCLGLWQELQALTLQPEPTQLQLGDWGRRTASMLILSLSVVFGSLVGCFGWLRAGFAGNGVRTLIWALLGLKVVTSSVAVMDLLNAAAKRDEDRIPDGELATYAVPILEDVSSSVLFWLPWIGGVLLLTLIAGFWIRRD